MKWFTVAQTTICIQSNTIEKALGVSSHYNKRWSGSQLASSIASNSALAMEVVTWRAQLEPSAIFAQFTTVFMPFLAEYFERAALKLENIESIYGGICFLSPCLEDISELVLNSNAIQSHTIRISELIGRAKGVIQSSLIRLAVDILVFASLVPCHLISAPRTRLDGSVGF